MIHFKPSRYLLHKLAFFFMFFFVKAFCLALVKKYKKKYYLENCVLYLLKVEKVIFFNANFVFSFYFCFLTNALGYRLTRLFLYVSCVTWKILNFCVVYDSCDT